MFIKTIVMPNKKSKYKINGNIVRKREVIIFYFKNNRLLLRVRRKYFFGICTKQKNTFCEENVSYTRYKIIINYYIKNKK